MNVKSLFLLLFSSVLCVLPLSAQMESTPDGTRAAGSTPFDVKQLASFVNQSTESLKNRLDETAESNGLGYKISYEGARYLLTIKEDRGVVDAIRLQLIDASSAESTWLALMQNGDPVATWGAFFGAKFVDGSESGLAQTLENAIARFTNSQDKMALRIAPTFSVVPGVYFVVEFNKGALCLHLMRSWFAFDVTRLALSAGSLFEGFYNAHWFITNKINVFGQLSLYCGAAKDAEGDLFTISWNADSSTPMRMKDLQMLLDTEDAANESKLSSVWTRYLKDWTALDKDFKLYVADVFGGVTKELASVEEALAYYREHQRTQPIVLKISHAGRAMTLKLDGKGLQIDVAQPTEPTIVMQTRRQAGESIEISFMCEEGPTIEGVEEIIIGDGQMRKYKLTSSTIVVKGAGIAQMECPGDDLVRLDLFDQAELLGLDCSDNHLSTLDFSQTPSLMVLLVANNLLVGEGMTYMMRSLPDLSAFQDQGMYGAILVYDEALLSGAEDANRCLPSDVALAKARSWQVFYQGYDEGGVMTELPYEGWEEKRIANILLTLADSQSVGSDKVSVALRMEGQEGDKVQVEWSGEAPIDYTIGAERQLILTHEVASGAQIGIFGSIEGFEASSDQVAEVKLYKTSDLRKLRLNGNKISELDLREAPNLQELAVADNLLSELSLSFVPELATLDCSGNALSSLKFSLVKKLTELKADRNKLTRVDLTSLSNLTSVSLADNAIVQLQLTHEPTAAHLSYVALTNNKLTACDINDLLTYLPTIHDGDKKASYNIYLTGNPGGDTYDVALLPKGSEGNLITWTCDVEGDGTGCGTAKIRDISADENASAKLFVAGAEVAFGEAIQKGSKVDIVIVPKADYAVDMITMNGESLAEDAANHGHYPHVLKHNGVLLYTLVLGNDPIFSSGLRFAQTADGVALKGLPAGDPYALYTVSGQMVAQGSVAADGSLELVLPMRGSYLLRIGVSTLKIRF